MRLRLRRRAVRRPATFEPLEARCLLAGLDLQIGAIRPLPHALAEPASVSASGGRFGSAVDLARVRDLYGFTGQGQTIAVIDTGIAYDQQALGNGFGSQARVVGGFDFAENDADPYDDGPAGFHGTHVAGIIASADADYEGIAPGVDLVALRVFDDLGNGNLQWVEQSLRWIDEHRDSFRYPITTVNMSLGTPWNSDTPPGWSTLEDELRSLTEHGVLVVAAAGNSFAQYGSPGLSYPAASRYVLPVGSLNEGGTLSSFSQRHPRMVAARGENIVSTVPDHLFSRDGRDDDWAAASGTSMAAPVVAGSAAVLREAMQVFDVGPATPASLIELMHESSVSVWDSVTGQSYDALNLMEALNRIAPADDFGDDSASAHSLGVVRGDTTISGVMSTRQDRDVFQFQVAASGWLSLDVQAVGHSQVRPTWEVSGATKQFANGTWQYFVQAGTDYELQIATSAGVGHYELTLQYDAAAVHWGSVTDGVFYVTPSVDRYGLTASQDGLVSITDSASAANWRVQDAQGQWYSPKRNRGGAWQVDVVARAGDELVVQFDAPADRPMRVMNRVQLRHGVLTISAGTNSSKISVGLGTKVHVAIDGVRYAWRRESVGAIRISGHATDSIVVYGSNASEEVIWAGSSVSWSSPVAAITASGFQNVRAYGGGGIDDVFRLFGTDGEDSWTASGQSSEFRTRGVHVSADGFDRMYFDGRGGKDTVTLAGTAGNDELIGRGDELRLFGHGYHLRVTGAESISVTGGGGRDDVARLYGSAAADRWSAADGHGEWTVGDSARTISAFDRVYVYDFDGAGDSIALQSVDGLERFDIGADEVVHRAERWFQRIEGWKDLLLQGGEGESGVAYLSGGSRVERIGDLANRLAEAPDHDDASVLQSLDAFFADLASSASGLQAVSGGWC